MDFSYNGTIPEYIINFLQEGKRYTITEKKQIRSLNQNRYYWGVCVPIIGEWMGEENEFVHEVLKSLFLEKKVLKNPLDKRRKIILQESTADLDTKDFTEFIENIREKFKELRIPAPDDGSAIDAYNYYNKI